MGSDLIDRVAFDSDGFVPCVVQDWGSGDVLMLAYMNSEALRKTLELKQLHFWSRSRDQLWHKGATSGNTQELIELRYDCDLDSLLALVKPAGPACHTGERTCFYRADGREARVSTAEYAALPELGRTLKSRNLERPAESYTTALLDSGVDAIGAKVSEEAAEVVQAAQSESDQRLAEESADLLYHLAVLLEQRGLSFNQAFKELIKRMD